MTLRIFDDVFFNELIDSALASQRLRSHFSLHDSYQSKVQRLLIALIKGTYIPPHYHELPHQWEYFQVIKGTVSLIIFDNDSGVKDIIQMGDGEATRAIEIPPKTIHTLLCRSETAIVLECKEGPFEVEFAKILPVWAPDESYDIKSRTELVDILYSLEVGDSIFKC